MLKKNYLVKKRRKALFLDRDGVINIDKGHVHKIRDFVFIDSIFELCKKYQDDGFLIIVITNQAGIAKGMYDEHDYQKLTSWMIQQFKHKSISITKVYHCPHHPNYSSCLCRKPSPGMILEAEKEFNINLTESVLYGDKDSDIEAGKRAGIKNNYKV